MYANELESIAQRAAATEGRNLDMWFPPRSEAAILMTTALADRAALLAEVTALRTALTPFADPETTPTPDDVQTARAVLGLAELAAPAPTEDATLKPADAPVSATETPTP